ncbi:hypothetical protein Naga_100191g8 [Nannochloropsis gaditana]|uniref:Uncharacterized protein n=1 Tax=Nannochloropsis gaditana TaxID=72520 RepID=W7TTI0_9STRA|nr:hypothetical protein Naga_100191g8 [Nannochloropsis gaditana]
MLKPIHWKTIWWCPGLTIGLKRSAASAVDNRAQSGARPVPLPGPGKTISNTAQNAPNASYTLCGRCGSFSGLGKGLGGGSAVLLQASSRVSESA